MSQTILVTGGAGQIGQVLCQSFLKREHTVFCLDSFITSNKNDITSLVSNSCFHLIEGDIIDTDLSQLPHLDSLYHLACPASPKHYQSNPIHTLDTCYIGTKRLLDLALSHSARIFIASTSEVYGNPSVHPQPESYWGSVNPIGPRSCYDEGKRIMESLATSYSLRNEISVRIARIFNTYGPTMQFDDGRVISNFVIQALSNNPITIYGDGLQTRSFCYVDDTVNGILALMENTSANETPFNIGNNEERTVLSVAQFIVNACNSTSQIVYHDLPHDDPIRRQPDISRAYDILNWQPNTPFELGIHQTIQSFKKRLTPYSY